MANCEIGRCSLYLSIASYSFHFRSLRTCPRCDSPRVSSVSLLCPGFVGGSPFTFAFWCPAPVITPHFVVRGPTLGPSPFICYGSRRAHTARAHFFTPISRQPSTRAVAVVHDCLFLLFRIFFFLFEAFFWILFFYQVSPATSV